VLRRLEGLSQRERMRWHDLLHFVLSWALRRRPSGEQSEILETAQNSQEDVGHREEIERLGKMIGQSWEQELLARGQILAQRKDLQALLEERFGAVPEAVAARIEAADDPDRLRNALRRAIRIASPEELEL
jgi:hypothetical protein